ncbi:MAG: hypothetical protein IKV26_03205 [Paludibacteraceae bacterium]|nr:hypothetical protein [Paludibacteraceae bacterium]
MKLIINNLEEVSLNYLKKLQTVEADLEIAKRVVSNDNQSVNYFLGEFSIPFLDYIGGEIMHLEGCCVNGILCFHSSVSSEYYEFIGAKFIKNQPTWHKVSLYKGIKNKGGKEARLYTYINTITVRHFINVKNKLDKNKEKSLDDMLETMSVSILKDYDGFDEILLEEDDSKYKELDVAWENLPKKDQLILKYLVIEDRNPLEIFDEMIQYIETTIPPEQYTRKQKQDAMSLMKRRAKHHLRMLIVEQRKQNKQ